MNEIIKNIFIQFIDLSINKVFLFGSRINGNWRPNSDLDVLIDDKIKIEKYKLVLLDEAFENSDLPYKVNVILRSEITDEFYDQIVLGFVEL